MKTELQDVTLISIITDSAYVDKIVAANLCCTQHIKFGANKLICPPDSTGFERAEIEPVFAQIDWKEYSPWILKNLNSYIDTPYCLVYQYDGYIINPDLWSADFFNYDYIGAIWQDVGQVNRVGNGGFSFRSKKLLELSTKIYPDPHSKHKAEDWTICVDNFNYMIGNGIKFADIPTARQFSVEHQSAGCSFVKGDLSTYKSFGFHDKTNTAAMRLAHG